MGMGHGMGRGPEDIDRRDHRRPADEWPGGVVCDGLATHADRHALRRHRSLPCSRPPCAYQARYSFHVMAMTQDVLTRVGTVPR
jgi:hypothetical protein